MPHLFKKRFVALVFAALLAGASSRALAESDLIGTAGPIRAFGGANCAADAGSPANCELPKLDPSASAKQRTDIRIARIRWFIGHFQEQAALLELDAAIADNPMDTSALLLRGRLRIPGQLAEAIKDMNRVLNIEPNNPDALATRAFILAGQDSRAAEKDIDAAISLQPKNPDARWIRANILAGGRRFAEAEADLTAALAINNGDTRARLSRARMRLHQGNPCGAEDDASEILKHQGNPAAIEIRAIARTLGHDYEGALGDFDRILPSSSDPQAAQPQGPGLVNLYVQRAMILIKLGRVTEAKRDFETITAQGGQRELLQIQLYLRSHGMPDTPLDGKDSDQLHEAIKSCFINDACGRGLTLRT
ncbi:MAG TPA: tetratricopeptide repeat protein [Xanthobacteraceae bacterium]|jgi:tetratricopeptide (TPR) repeat protein